MERNMGRWKVGGRIGGKFYGEIGEMGSLEDGQEERNLEKRVRWKVGARVGGKKCVDMG